MQRQRREELVRPLVVDHEDLSGPSHARRRERRERPLRRAGTGVPTRTDRGERPQERRLDTAVEALDPPGLERDAAEAVRLDREAGVLEPPEDPLPGVLGLGGVLLDEHEPRTRRERLPHPHPRPDALCLRGGGHRSEQRLLAGRGSERRRAEREPRPRPQRGSQLEPWDDDAGGHGNVCSTRTHVPLSRSTFGTMLTVLPSPD